MIYVIGDIHGCKDKYEKMLDMLSPGEHDAVFVLGDVIDVGDSGIEILKDMMYRANIYPVLGEREYYAKKLLPLIAEAGSIEKAKGFFSEENRVLLEKWLSLKAEKTITDFLSQNDEEKEAILDFLDEFNPFEEIKCKGKKFILTHAGIRNFEEDKPLEDYCEEDFVFAETDYTKIYFSDAYLVTGHTPTIAISKELAGKVYAKKRHLALDCAAAFGGRLAAVCLDTLKVYYC